MFSADGSAGPKTVEVMRMPKEIAMIATKRKKNLKKSSVKNLFIRAYYKYSIQRAYKASIWAKTRFETPEIKF